MGEAEVNLQEIVEFLKTKAPFVPQVGVVCGSGLGGLASVLENTVEVDYKDIPSFPQPTVAGHAGKLIFGLAGPNKTKVVCLKGRFHSYEGHPMKVVAMPGRLFKVLGCKFMLVTNAAGGLNRSFNIGDLMVMSDHIGFPLMSGRNPLVGENDPEFGPRFPPMSNAYDVKLRKAFVGLSKKHNLDFVQESGTYCMVSGPNYETAAECKALHIMGADAVGMSTVPEVTLAHHCGVRILGLSLITNKAVFPGDTTPPASHEEVLETVALRTEAIQKLVLDFLNLLSDDSWEQKL